MKMAPWFILIPTSGILLTSDLLPSSIELGRKGVYYHVPIPGLDYQPFVSVRTENAKLTMTIPTVARAYSQGNSFEQNAFDLMISTDIQLLQFGEKQWGRIPPILYSGWGTHMPPMLYQVHDLKQKPDIMFTHPRSGLSTFTENTLTLEMKQDNYYYIAWKKLAWATAVANKAVSKSRAGTW